MEKTIADEENSAVDPVQYPQVIDTALLHETQDSQNTELPVVQQFEQQSSNTRKSVLAFIILYAIASSVGVTALITSLVFNAVRNELSFSFPEVCGAFVLFVSFIIGFVGMILLKHTYANKILYSFATPLAFFYAMLQFGCIVMLAFNYNSINWFSIIINFIIFGVNLTQLGCSIYLTIYYSKMDSNAFEKNLPNKNFEKHTKRITIAMIVLESIVVSVIIIIAVIGAVLNMGWLSWLIIFAAVALIGSSPLIGLLCSIFQLKFNSKITAGIAFGANLFPLLILIPAYVFITLRVMGVTIFEFNDPVKLQFKTGGYDGLAYLVLGLYGVVGLVGIIIPDFIICCLSMAVIAMGKNQSKW